jgi:hypothetical protein
VRIAIDFDGVIVAHGRYTDLATPLRFLPGAREGLLALKRAGHQLLLWSGRASLALRKDPRLDPFVRAGQRQVHPDWRDQARLHEARFQQLLEFVGRELPGAFDAIDDGTLPGKPDVDLFIDDQALRLGHGPAAFSWRDIAGMYGQPSYGGPPRR